jgi:hypothetical protein
VTLQMRRTAAQRANPARRKPGRKPAGPDRDWLAPIPHQQFLFVIAYLRNGGNLTAAAIEAGYSERSAAETACALMNKPHIRHAIIREQQAIRAASKIEALDIIAGLMLEAKHATQSRERIRAWTAIGMFHGLDKMPFRPGIKNEDLTLIDPTDLGALNRDQLVQLEEIMGALEAARKARLEGAKQIEHDPGDAEVEATLVEEEAGADDTE